MSDSTVTRPRSKRRPLAERFWEKVGRDLVSRKVIVSSWGRRKRDNRATH